MLGFVRTKSIVFAVSSYGIFRPNHRSRTHFDVVYDSIRVLEIDGNIMIGHSSPPGHDICISSTRSYHLHWITSSDPIKISSPYLWPDLQEIHGGFDIEILIPSRACSPDGMMSSHMNGAVFLLSSKVRCRAIAVFNFNKQESFFNLLRLSMVGIQKIN